MKNKIIHTMLNIAAGKFLPLELPRRYYLINLDTMYFQANSPAQTETNYFNWRRNECVRDYCNGDAYEFMERTKITFDHVTIYRFLEHVPMDKVLYFIYLLSCITDKGSEIDIIVPNYRVLASALLNEKTDQPNFESHNVLLTTELLNEPSCPHASIWSVDRAQYFFGLEGRFKIKDCVNRFEYDDRDIYLRFTAERT